MLTRSIQTALSFILFCLTVNSVALSEPALQTRLSDSQYLNNRVIDAKKLFDEGEYGRSEELFIEILSLAEKRGNLHIKATALYSLGILSWNLGSIDTAKDYLQSALSAYLTLGDRAFTDSIVNALEVISSYISGKKFRQENDFRQAIATFENAILLSRNINSDALLLKCLRQLSLVYWDLKQYRQYYSLCIEALEIAKSSNNGRELSYLYNNIGNYYWKNDKYTEALKFYEQSLPLALSYNIPNLYSTCLNNIGVVYIDIGNFDKALDYCIQALNHDKGSNNANATAIDLLNIGVIHRRRGLLSNSQDELHKASGYFQDFLVLSEINGNKTNALIALNNLGTIYSDLNDFIQAREYFNKALVYADFLNDKENRSMIFNNLGIVELNLGNLKASTDHFQKAIDIAQRLGSGQVLWEAYFELGNTYAKQDKYSEALTAYKDSIAIIENIRSAIQLEENKASYLGSDKRLDAYYNIIDLLLKMHHSLPNSGYDRQAFNYLERGKARAFLDSLEIADIEFDDSTNIFLDNQENVLMAEISSIYTKLLNPGFSDEEKANFGKAIKRLEEDLEALKQKIRETSPAYANLKYPKIITFNDLPKNLTRSDTTLFAFALGRDTSLAFAITRGHIKTYHIPSRADLQKRISEYRRTISDANTSDFHQGFELFKDLVQPGLAQNAKKLVIVPDDILHLLPFEALITEANSNHWLIEDCAISYAPSFSSLAYLANRKSNGLQPRKELLVFGDPYYGPDEDSTANTSASTTYDIFPSLSIKRLKYSGLEAKSLASLFHKSHCDIYLRQAAIEEKLKSTALADYRIIHFATHTFIDDKKPARSAILLSLDQDPTEDGLLQTREIYNMKIGADLVALSACQTGLGQFIRGEGIEGLNRAFFYAGASSVLISLWSVNDQATSQLMIDFYKSLKAAKTPIRALRDAKLSMIHSSTASHPFYWAGFIITGNVEYRLFSSLRGVWPISSFLILVIVILFVLKLKRRGISKPRIDTAS